MLNLIERENNSVQLPDEVDKAFFLNSEGDLVTKDQNGNIQYVTLSGTKPPKVYRALLTQSGTDAPVATVLDNTLGEVDWTREGDGTYRITGVGMFPTNKCFISCVYGGESANSMTPYLIESEDYIEFVNWVLITGFAVDGLQNAFVQILVYN
jgi:hypothetical protein